MPKKYYLSVPTNEESEVTPANPSIFRNIDNQRVLDDFRKQGIDVVMGLGSSSQVHCGKLLEDLLASDVSHSLEQLSLYVQGLYHVRYLRTRSASATAHDCLFRERLSGPIEVCIHCLYNAAPYLAVFQIREEVPSPSTRCFEDERF